MASVVSVRIADLPRFKRFCMELLDIRDEVRLLYPETDIAERIEKAVRAFQQMEDDTA